MKSASSPIEKCSVPPGPSDKYDSATDLFVWLKENFKRFGDIYRASVFGADVYVVSAPEYCERIFRHNWRNYLRKGLVVQRIALALGNNLITSNGEAWSSQRRMIQPAFTKSAIDRSINMMVEVNTELLEEWREAAKQGKTVNATRDVSLVVLKITLKSIFGEDYEKIAPGFRLFAEEAARDLKFAENLTTLRAQIMEVVTLRRRQERSSTDSLGIILQARDRECGQPMPDAQLAREVLNLVVAGHETTASLLNWMWYLLATHPEAQTKLGVEFDELPWEGNLTIDMLQNYTYARKVISEALRLYPPLWLMSRKSLKDDSLGEYVVPAGTEIYISPYLIQRSPQLWDLPDRFDPDRPNSDSRGLAFCPFGAGPRKCIGDVFARVEIQVHLMMFAKEFLLRCCEIKVPEIATGLNLLSKHDFKMLPEIKRCRKQTA
jgi:cytochrome P450